MAALQHDPAAPIPISEIFGQTMQSERDLVMPRISYGLPFDDSVPRHVAADAHVFIIASRTLVATTDSLQRLKACLGNRVKGTRVGMAAHTHLHECIEVTEAAHAVGADTIISIGGGSLTDAAKFVCMALANDLSTVERLDAVQLRTVNGKPAFGELQPATARLICIPTSLSAGEHTPGAGITNAETGQKYQIPSSQAFVTILDPWLAQHTPRALWLQSGVRAIDHCVESFLSPHGFPDVDTSTLRGLQLLLPGLLELSRDDTVVNDDAPARLNAQLGAALAILPIAWHVPAGASHAIGHMMGPMGVGHGETSCILLPAVCKYNAPATRARQSTLIATLWNIPACQNVFSGKGLERERADLGDLLDAIIRALGMPRSLKERGIEGDRVEELAKMSLNDAFLETNPVSITTKEQVLEILDKLRT